MSLESGGAPKSAQRKQNDKEHFTEQEALPKYAPMQRSTNEKQGQVNGAVSRSSMVAETRKEASHPWSHPTKPPAIFIGAAPDVNSIIDEIGEPIKQAQVSKSKAKPDTNSFDECDNAASDVTDPEMPPLVRMETRNNNSESKPNQWEFQGPGKSKAKKDDKGAREESQRLSRSLTPGNDGEGDKKAKKDGIAKEEGCQAKKIQNQGGKPEVSQASSMVKRKKAPDVMSDAKRKKAPLADVRPSDGIADNHSAEMMQQRVAEISALKTEETNAKEMLISIEVLIEVQHGVIQKELRLGKQLEASKKQCQTIIEATQKAIKAKKKDLEAKQKDLVEAKQNQMEEQYSYYSEEDGGPGGAVQQDPYSNLLHDDDDDL